MNRTLLARALVSLALVPTACAYAQNTESEVVQLRQSLAEAKAELRQNRQEIDDLKQRLALVEARLGGPAKNEGPTYPTAAIVQQEPQGVPSQAPSDDQDLLSAKVSDLDQVKVESASKYKVRLSGMVLMNTYMNGGNMDNSDLPNRVFRNIPGQPTGDFGATLRQSQIGLEVFGPKLAGASTHGSVNMDFFGGFPNTSYGSTAGIVRLRTASFRMDWKDTSLEFGQEAPIIAPLNPTSYATLGEPALSWAGNLWVWTPQIKVERRFTTGESSHAFVQGGILDPLTEENPEQYDREPNYGERSRFPAFAGRVGWEGTASGQTISFGIGGYGGRQNYNFDRNVTSWAVAGDWVVPIGKYLSWSGEAYRGNALGGLGGGIWMSSVFSGDPTLASTKIAGLNDVGGWMQFKVRPVQKLEFNAAAGASNPFSKDLHSIPGPTNYFGFPPLSRNQAAFVNGIYHPRSDLFFALEYRRLRSFNFAGKKQTGDHVNLAVGVSF